MRFKLLIVHLLNNFDSINKMLSRLIFQLLLIHYVLQSSE